MDGPIKEMPPHQKEEDEDNPQLSGDALAALKEFYTERDAHQQLFQNLKSQSEVDHASQTALSMDAFSEDWNASQFWYTDETARTLAEQLVSGCTAESRIAVVSAPSAFVQLKNIVAEMSQKTTTTTTTTSKVVPGKMTLLEFDERFAVFDEFVKYDFEHPIKLPAELSGRFDRIICDPPFLSEACQTKAALTVRWLAKNWIAPSSSSHSSQPSELENKESKNGLRLIVCTGERMESLIHKLYGKVGLHTTSFEVQHAKGLGNEFRCYANFSCDSWELLESNSS